VSRHAEERAAALARGDVPAQPVRMHVDRRDVGWFLPSNPSQRRVIGRRVQQLRLDAGMDVATLVDRSNLTWHHVYAIEEGAAYTRLALRMVLAVLVPDRPTMDVLAEVVG
jgi:hypothetical protein